MSFPHCIDIFSLLGLLLHYYWAEKIKTLDNSRYGIWFYLTTLVLGVVSSVLLVCVIRWYKARERDEIVNYQAMVEDIHYKYQQQEALNNNHDSAVAHIARCNN